MVVVRAVVVLVKIVHASMEFMSHYYVVLLMLDSCRCFHICLTIQVHFDCFNVFVSYKQLEYSDSPLLNL